MLSRYIYEEPGTTERLMFGCTGSGERTIRKNIKEKEEHLRSWDERWKNVNK